MSATDAILELPPSPIHSPSPEKTGSDDPIDRVGYSTRKDYVSSLLTALRYTHRYSAYTFSAFSVIHFLNTGVAPLLSAVDDLSFADENLTAARALYQNSYLSEAVLVFGALGVHVVSGTVIRLIRVAREYVWYRKNAKFPKLSRNAISGYVMLPFIIGHITANRWLPWKLNIDITSSLVGHWIAKHPRIGWSFYSAFVALSAFHLANGLGQFLGWKKKTKLIVNSSVMGLWLAGLVKVIAHGVVGGAKGRQYDILIEALADLRPTYLRS